MCPACKRESLHFARAGGLPSAVRRRRATALLWLKAFEGAKWPNTAGGEPGPLRTATALPPSAGPEPAAVGATPTGVHTHTPGTGSHTPDALAHAWHGLAHTGRARTHLAQARTHRTRSHTPGTGSHTPDALAHTHALSRAFCAKRFLMMPVTTWRPVKITAGGFLLTSEMS